MFHYVFGWSEIRSLYTCFDFKKSILEFKWFLVPKIHFLKKQSMYTSFEWDKLFQDTFISLLDVFIQNLSLFSRTYPILVNLILLILIMHMHLNMMPFYLWRKKFSSVFWMVSNWIVAYSLPMCVPLVSVLICCLLASVITLRRDAGLFFFV